MIQGRSSRSVIPSGHDVADKRGFGRNIDEQFRTLPWPIRAITKYSVWQPAADQLKAAGERLRAILPTDANSDDVSGLPDFPGVPVGVTPQEHEFIRTGGKGQFGEPFTAIHYEEYGFEGGPCGSRKAGHPFSLPIR